MSGSIREIGPNRWQVRVSCSHRTRARIDSSVTAEYGGVDVPGRQSLGPEPFGGKPGRVWLVDDVDDASLFKPVIVKDGKAYGDDKAERIASQVATLFGNQTSWRLWSASAAWKSGDSVGISAVGCTPTRVE